MNRIANIVAGGFLAVLILGVSAFAQRDEQKVVADVPFDFSVGRLSFPAGQYVFARTASNIVLVRDLNGHSLFTVSSGETQEDRTSGTPKLKFAVVGGRHVLVEMWNGLSANGTDFDTTGIDEKPSKPRFLNEE